MRPPRSAALLWGLETVRKGGGKETQTRPRAPAVRSSSPGLPPSPAESLHPGPRGPTKAKPATLFSLPRTVPGSREPDFAEARPAAGNWARDRPDRSPQPGPGGAGAGAVGPEQQHRARFRPARLRRRPRRPHNPLLAPGTGGAGRGGVGRAERAEIIFCFALAAPVPLRRDVLGRRRCGSGTHRLS